ncbi:MAG: HK97 family phage prohead protease [Deltaproteobacteria bacterium]
MRFDGYASVTESAYDLGWYSETIARGAFEKTLRERPDVVLNLQHGSAGSGLPIARTTSGTLRLSEDNHGLRAEADLDPEDADVQLASRKLARGDLDGQMSFAFQVVRDEWTKDYSKRTIREVSLHQGDVSIVVAGANPATSGGLRSRPSTQSERSRMASSIRRGRTVVTSRAFTISEGPFGYRAPSLDAPEPEACHRCHGEGSIVLQGKQVTCPQCKGTGGPDGNIANDAVASQGMSPIGINAARPGSWRRLSDLGASARRDEAALRAALELSATDSARDRLALERARGDR